MKCKRLNEVLELLQPYWSKDPDLSLLQILQKIADEAGFDKPVAELSDEVIIYHLKMHGTDKLEPIPGIKKIMKKIFKTALLKARRKLLNRKTNAKSFIFTRCFIFI